MRGSAVPADSRHGARPRNRARRGSYVPASLSCALLAALLLGPPLLLRTSPLLSAGTTPESAPGPGSAPAHGAGSHGGGHYLSFARERNLEMEMMRFIDDPALAETDYALERAQRLHDALRTPGVQGIWMTFNWRTLEVDDSRYDWSLIDANMKVADRYGLELIVQVSDRSYRGGNVLPEYFPTEYVLWSTGGGKSGYVSKRWDPYVYTRTIRLYQAIARRYADHPAFGGIATAETAIGNVDPGAGYDLARYSAALIRIATDTQASLPRGKLFLYLNFLKDGAHLDMRKDARVDLLRRIPHDSLVIGAPDITPDVAGMPGSVNSYRVHVRRNLATVRQFCHLQHVDQGLGGINVKTNRHRRIYLGRVQAIRAWESLSRSREAQSLFEFDDLSDSADERTDLHLDHQLGTLWQPEELFRFGRRNFACDYVFWHLREYPREGEFGWPDVRPVIVNNQRFHERAG
jgi:hypothetical protein